MAHNPELDHHKRKRNDDDNGKAHSDRIPQPPPPQSGNPVPINYLSKANAAKLKLIHGDGDAFSDVLTLINKYEGVLSRHESLASNLGAKLTGPRLLKAMEGVFEGPITTTPPQTIFTQDPVTWLDIVKFAKAKPGELSLSATPSGARSCQFSLKNVQVEITEDDWRLIVSGALDRFRLVPPQPLEEDETAELATLDILEQHLQVLIKKADEVARKARQLNYHLSGRKAAINGRRSSQQTPSSGSGFQAVNQPGRGSRPNTGYDLHADLLQQFLTHPPSTMANDANHGVPSVGSVPPTPGVIATASSTPRTSIQQQVLTSMSNRPSPGYHPEAAHGDSEEEYRALVTAKVERLARGDVIYPPCDRCRRLKTSCVKHLTACQGCTKKHARCVWKGVTEEEAAWLKKEAGDGEDEGDESRDRGLSSNSALSSQHDHSEPRRNSDRSEDAGPSRSASRIAIGRSADDMWRKGPSSTGRHDSMDVDVDPRDTRGTRPTMEHANPQEGMSRNPIMLSHMATVATTAADITTYSKGNAQAP
ncbi:hypothetical protein BJ170DRAFT_319613 [Xylariales sp. AK1849]|nr:hypothetical protein BJ170DRAFT_319613 [Xylariales sp. AK1849]